MAANRLFFVFILVVLTISNGISAAAEDEKSQPTTSSSQTIAVNKTSVDNSTKQMIDSLGPSQDYPDYEIPKELAPDGVAVVEDYTPISPAGVKDTSDPIAQPEADKDIKTSPSSSASRSSSIVLVVVGLVGGASLFFF